MLDHVPGLAAPFKRDQYCVFIPISQVWETMGLASGRIPVVTDLGDCPMSKLL